MTQPRHGAGGEQRGDSTRTGDATGERGGGAKAAEAEAETAAAAGEVAAAAEAEAEEEEEAEAVATFERCLVPCCREAEVWLVLSRAPTLSLTQP